MGKKKYLTHLVWRTAWKTRGVRSLEKVLGNCDERGCLGKVLARLHARLPVGLGWDWCFQKGVGGDVGESAWKFLMGGGAWEKCLQACMRVCRVGWAGIGTWKLPRVNARKKCSGCSYQEVLGNSSSNNTTAHHHVEAIVVCMGQRKKVSCEYQSRDVTIPLTKYTFYGKHISYMCHSDVHGWYRVVHGWYSRCTQTCIINFLTPWVFLVHDCVLQVHALHKVFFFEPFGSILWGQVLQIIALGMVCVGRLQGTLGARSPSRCCQAGEGGREGGKDRRREESTDIIPPPLSLPFFILRPMMSPW